MPEHQWWFLHVNREQSSLQVRTLSNTAIDASTVELPSMESRYADILVAQHST